MAERHDKNAGNDADKGTGSGDGVRSDGFLSRWAQRKQAVKAGLPVAQAPVKPGVAENTVNLQSKPVVAQAFTAQPATNSVAPESSDTAAKTTPEIPPPTLDDARALTTESDFKPFMAKNVSPEVKNAAMKKLFTDPHYNVMDMMDTYVDDYSKPDPIPESMLREMVAVKFLRLFERDEEEPVPAADKTAASPAHAQDARDDADSPAAQTVTQSDATASHALPANPPADLPSQLPSQPAPAAASHPSHDHPDLRLQPNHAPERPGTGRSAG
jgi:Protein of unknown function (DUF3306)